MTENPYRLARDIRGIGFKTADAMAMKLGIEKNAIVRVRAGISYALTEAMDEGHRGLPTEELTPLAEKLLEVPQALIRTALDLELQEGTVVADRVGETPCVFLAGLHRAERTIAAQLMRLAGGMLPWPWIDPEKALPWVEERPSSCARTRVAATCWSPVCTASRRPRNSNGRPTGSSATSMPRRCGARSRRWPRGAGFAATSRISP
jgi:exodeoxyribonuclease V alpha subunit